MNYSGSSPGDADTSANAWASRTAGPATAVERELRTRAAAYPPTGLMMGSRTTPQVAEVSMVEFTGLLRSVSGAWACIAKASSSNLECPTVTAQPN